MMLTITVQAAGGFDVNQATQAYLHLLHGAARAQSDAYFEGGYWLVLWNAVAAVVVAGVILASGWSARWRTWAERVTRRRWLVPAVYAPLYTLGSTMLLLPGPSTRASGASGSTD